MGECQEADPKYQVAKAIHMVSTRLRTMPLEGVFFFQLELMKSRTGEAFSQKCQSNRSGEKHV